MDMCYGVVLLIVFFYVKHCLSLGTCSRTSSAKSHAGVLYYTKYFCCDNSETHKGACRECPTGFTSKAGSKCIPCPGNSYGLRCADHCKCQTGERCDHQLGCVKPGDEKVTIDKSDFYTFKHLTTNLSSSPVNNTSNISKVDIYGSKDDSMNEIKLSYGIWGGSAISAIVLMALFVVILWKYRISKKKERLDSIRSNIPLTQHSNMSNTIEDQSATSEEGHDYEEIEESDLLREPITSSNASNNSNNSSNDDSVTGGTDNDGYLHPYNSLYSSDIGLAKYTEREITKNIQGKDSYSVSITTEKLSQKNEALVSADETIYFEVIDKEDIEDEDDQNADCNKVVFFL